MSKLYTIGFQPIEVVGKDYEVIDLLNVVASTPNCSGRLKPQLISLMQQTVTKDNIFFANTVYNRTFIPYAYPLFKHVYLYDPPYVSSEGELTRSLRQLANIFGSEKVESPYLRKSNSLRSAIIATQDTIPPADYYNALTLLSDVNKGSPEGVIQYLNSKSSASIKPPVSEAHKAIFIGDLVNPEYISYLYELGVSVLKYLPYEFCITPVDRIDEYYYNSFIFKPNWYLENELKNMIDELGITMLILNPGGIYLSQDDAEFFASRLGTRVTTYILPGTYEGSPIGL